MEFPTEKFKAKRDRYAKARGGTSKFLYIACAQCDEPNLVYQKDGPGRLLRMYADRIVWPPEQVEAQSEVSAETVRAAGALACRNCKSPLGLPMVYQSENRPAYRVIPGNIKVFRHPNGGERAN